MKIIFMIIFQIFKTTSISSNDFNSTTKKCFLGKVLRDVIFEAGTNAGKYIEANEVANDAECGAQCCLHSKCDAAFILGAKCFLVICKSYESCRISQSPDLNLKPRLIFVTRQNNEGVYHSIFSDDQKFPWTPNVCPPLVALKKVTLKGGLTSGEFTDIGPMISLEQCYNICCQKNNCDLAFMLASNCFTVNCNKISKFKNNGCILEPTIDSPFNPEAAHMLSRINLNQNYGETKEWTDNLNFEAKTTTPTLKINVPLEQVTFQYPIENQQIIYSPQIFNPFEFNPNNQYPFKIGNEKYELKPNIPEISQVVVTEPSKELMRGYFMIDTNQLTNNQYTTKTSLQNLDSLFIETKENECKFDPVYYNTSLKFGKNAGVFIKSSRQVKTLDSCIWACCSAKNESFTCETIFWVSDNCYLVDCYDELSCEKVPAVSLTHNPQIVNVRLITSNKFIITTPHIEHIKTTPKQSAQENTTLKNFENVEVVKEVDSKCLHQDILWNMTLKGATKAFNDKYISKSMDIETAKILGNNVKQMKECTNMCCDDIECDAVILEDNKCLSVSCSKNPGACTPVILKSNKKETQLAFMIKNENQVSPSYLNSKMLMMGGIGLGATVIVCFATLITIISSNNIKKNKRKYSNRRPKTSVSKSNEESSFTKSEEEQEKDRLEELLSKVSASFAKNKNRR